jgi:hypothetical protein
MMIWKINLNLFSFLFLIYLYFFGIWLIFKEAIIT